jgi:hypothetical protein
MCPATRCRQRVDDLLLNMRQVDNKMYNNFNTLQNSNNLEEARKLLQSPCLVQQNLMHVVVSFVFL